MPKLKCRVIQQCFVTGALVKADGAEEPLNDAIVTPDQIVVVDSQHPRASRHVGVWLEPIEGLSDDGDKLPRKAFEKLVEDTAPNFELKPPGQAQSDAVNEAVAKAAKAKDEELSALRIEFEAYKQEVNERFEREVNKRVQAEVEKLTAPPADASAKKK